MESLVPKAFAVATATVTSAKTMAIVSAPLGMIVNKFYPMNTGAN